MKGAPNYSIKFLRVVSLIGVIVFGLFTIIGTGGGSSDKNESTGTESITTGDFETTTIQEGNFEKSGTYALEIFENGLPAQQQLNQDNIPNVLEQHSYLYVLDIQNWPSDWDIGSVIVVRMKDGRIEYKRLLAKFELSDGRLAIGVEEASALEVFEQMEINTDGNLTGFARNVRNVPTNIINYDFERSKKVTIINETDMPLFNKDGVYLGFSEISLTMNPTFKVHITINKPSEISQIVGTVKNLKNSIMDIVHGQLNELDNVIVEAGQVIVGIHLTQTENIMRLISSNENVIDFLGAIRAVLVDRKRLKEAIVSLDGDIIGIIRIKAQAAGTCPIMDKEVPLLPPLLIPISGPIPIFLEFEPVGEARIQFDAEANAEAGMTVTVPVSIRAEVITGELQPLVINNINPEFSFPDEYISFKEIKGGFTPSIGVQVECGLSLAKILTVSIDPTASVVFDADASIQGNDDQGCADLDWDIYGKLSAEAEAELLSIWDVSSEIPFDIKVFDEVEPCGFYQYCWGGYCADNDGDGYYTHSVCGTALDCNDNDASINPGAPEICDDSKDNDCDGYTDCNDSECIGDPACKVCTDADSDGYYLESGCGKETDCNDNDASINPGAPEICDDSKDNDCDGYTDCNDSECFQDIACLICTDNDGDGYYAESGCGTAVDPNDNNANIHPGVVEIWDDFSTDTTDDYEVYFWERPDKGGGGESYSVQYDSINERAFLTAKGGYGKILMKKKEHSLIEPHQNFSFSIGFETLQEYNAGIYLGDLSNFWHGTHIVLRAECYLDHSVGFTVTLNGDSVLSQGFYASNGKQGTLKMQRINGLYRFYFNGVLLKEEYFDEFEGMDLHYGVMNEITSGSSGWTAKSAFDNWNAVIESP